MYDLIVRGGCLVYPWGTQDADVAIAGEKIAAIAEAGVLTAARREIAASGCYVLPGLIDAHTHFKAPIFGDAGSSDFFAAGTRAALFGGITTVIDFVIPAYGESAWDKFQQRQAQARTAWADYAFHAALVEAHPARLAEIAPLIEAGIASLKVFLISVNRGPCCDAFALDLIMAEAKKHAVVVGVHAEDPRFERRELMEGPEPWRRQAEIKDARCEEMAVIQALACAERHGQSLYIHHVTTRAALERIEQATGRGTVVFGETCPHYLEFNDSVYDSPAGYRFLMSPPIKQEEDRRALWRALGDGRLQVVTSDHCPYTDREKKELQAHGVAGIETSLPLLYTHGVAEGKLRVEDLARLMSYNPAKIFGLYPRKGLIAPGSDADLTIYDPRGRKALRHEELHMNTGYLLYQGVEVQGGVAAAVRRGEIMVERGEFTGKNPGEFIPGRYPAGLSPANLGPF